MEKLHVDDPQAVQRAAEVLRVGGVIVYPTDTVYGLGADALSDTAVAKLYKLKRREAGKPIHAIFASIAMAERYAECNALGESLAQRFLPGSLTLILKKKPGIDTGICRVIETVGIRIPNNDFCLALAREFDAPYTTTSANLSGEATGRSVDAILTQLGDQTSMIDLVIDAGELPECLPSTVVDVSEGEVRVLREGAVSICVHRDELQQNQ